MNGHGQVLIVVVLYRVTVDGSKTLRGLAQAFAEDPALLQEFQVLLWDNSPTAQSIDALQLRVRYHHAVQNAGVSGAYNGAGRIAHKSAVEWLLLFDHDTEVTGDFLRGVLRHADRVHSDPQIAAVAPILLEGRFVLSPRLWQIGRHVPVQTDVAPHRESRRMFAANSGSLMRLSALDAVGGYSKRFWLDYSDIDVFERLHQAGFSVWIATDLRLQHEIALLDYDARMTPSRYENYLGAESDFLDLYRGVLERILHLPRLAVRTVRQRRFADRSFSLLTRRELWRRIFRRRARRIRDRS